MTGPVALGERIRSSWSFEPMIFLILGVVLAQCWHYGVPDDAESTARLFR